MRGRNPLEARRGSRLTDEFTFQIPFLCREGRYANAHTKDSCTLDWTERHPDTSTGTHTRQEYWLLLPIQAGNSGNSGDLHYRCLCIFSWLSSSCASSETCSTKHKLTWHQLLPCAAFTMQSRTEQTVAAVVKSARSSAVSLQWLQQPFSFSRWRGGWGAVN